MMQETVQTNCLVELAPNLRESRLRVRRGCTHKSRKRTSGSIFCEPGSPQARADRREAALIRSRRGRWPPCGRTSSVHVRVHDPLTIIHDQDKSRSSKKSSARRGLHTPAVVRAQQRVSSMRAVLPSVPHVLRYFDQRAFPGFTDCSRCPLLQSFFGTAALSEVHSALGHGLTRIYLCKSPPRLCGSALHTIACVGCHRPTKCDSLGLFQVENLAVLESV